MTTRRVALLVAGGFILVIGVLPLLYIGVLTLEMGDNLGSSAGSSSVLARAMESANARAIPRTLVLGVFSATSQFLIAVLLARATWSTGSASRVSGFLLLAPLSIAPIAAALMWKALFDTSDGAINRLLVTLHIPGAPWLTSQGMGMGMHGAFSEASWGRAAILIAESWLWIPFLYGGMLLACNRVPRHLIEAAALDGAGRGAIFWRIICPTAVPSFAFLFLLRLFDAVRSFDFVWAFFGEQAPMATISTRVFTLAYLARDYPVAATITIMAVLAMIPPTLAFVRVLRTLVREDASEDALA